MLAPGAEGSRSERAVAGAFEKPGDERCVEQADEGGDAADDRLFAGPTRNASSGSVAALTVLPSAPMARPISNLSKFILSLPQGLAAAEVVKKAKEAGMVTSAANVARVRTDQKKRSTRAATSAGKPPVKAAKKPAKTATKAAPPAAPKSAGPVATKADFVRSIPHAMPVKEVVAAAKAAGVELTEKYVYNVRSSVAKKGKPAKAASKKPVAAFKTVAKPKATAKAKAVAKAPARTTSAGGSDEVELRKLVLALGVVRARQLLGELERGLAALIGS